MANLRITEAATCLGVSAMTLHRWASRGLIPYIELPSGQRRFRQEDLRRILRPKRNRRHGEASGSVELEAMEGAAT